MSNYLFKHPVTPLSNVNGDYVNVDGSNWPGRFGSTETSREFALPDNFSNKVDAANASRLSMKGGGRTIRKKIKNIVNKYRMGSKKMRRHTKKRLRSMYKRKGSKSSNSSKKMRRSRSRSRRRGGNAVLNAPIISSQNMQLVNGSNAYNLPTGAGSVDGVVNPYNLDKMMGGKKRRNKRNGKRSRKGMQKGGYHQFQSGIPITNSYSTGGILSAKDSMMAMPVPVKVLPNCTNCVDNYNYNTNRGFQAW